jgi:hypothetical protein
VSDGKLDSGVQQQSIAVPTFGYRSNSHEFLFPYQT